MERNIYRYQDAMAVKVGIDRVEYDQTKKEKYDEAKMVLRDVGSINGDEVD